MKLADFMRLKGLTDEALSVELNVSRVTVNRLRRGKQVPSIGLAGRVAEVTKNAVTANDFLPSLHPTAPAPSPEEGARV